MLVSEYYWRTTWITQNMISNFHAKKAHVAYWKVNAATIANLLARTPSYLSAAFQRYSSPSRKQCSLVAACRLLVNLPNGTAFMHWALP